MIRHQDPNTAPYRCPYRIESYAHLRRNPFDVRDEYGKNGRLRSDTCLQYSLQHQPQES